MDQINIWEGHSSQTIKKSLNIIFDSMYDTPVKLFNESRIEVPDGYRFITFHFNNKTTDAISTGLFTLFSFKNLTVQQVNDLFSSAITISERLIKFKRLLMTNYINNFNKDILKQNSITYKYFLFSDRINLEWYTQFKGDLIVYFKDDDYINTIHKNFEIAYITEVKDFYIKECENYIGNKENDKMIRRIISSLYILKLNDIKNIIFHIVIFQLYNLYLNKKINAPQQTSKKEFIQIFNRLNNMNIQDTPDKASTVWAVPLINLDNTKFIQQLPVIILDKILHYFHIQIKIYDSHNLMPYLNFQRGLYFNKTESSPDMLFYSGIIKLDEYQKLDLLSVHINPGNIEKSKELALIDNYKKKDIFFSTDIYYKNIKKKQTN
jgi:hypothetical protein